MIKGYDEWKTSLPEDSMDVIHICPICEYEMFEGEGVVHVGVDDEYVCTDCFEEWAKEALDAKFVFITRR